MTKPKSPNGQVLRIEKSSIYDGAGLRTVVFLKGCNLRCVWCSTPESQKMSAEKGFDAERCQNCGHCLAACPADALHPNNNGSLTTDNQLCCNCFACVVACPYQAQLLYGQSMTVEQVLQEVRKDEIFYFHSGGGLTISGGEPLLQADFCAALLRACRASGIDTALETSFGIPWPQISKVLPDLDTLFVDLKHYNATEHQQWVGADNRQILANIRQAASLDLPFKLIIRIPVVPNVNDSAENLLATAEFCHSLPKLTALQLLPYHRLGTVTYSKLNREYALTDTKTPDKFIIATWYDLIRSNYPLLPLL
jgi:pyruvate formate lyase activating enzyme